MTDDELLEFVKRHPLSMAEAQAGRQALRDAECNEEGIGMTMDLLAEQSTAANVPFLDFVRHYVAHFEQTMTDLLDELGLAFRTPNSSKSPDKFPDSDRRA